jgi:peptidoglycan hydrolase-like protein with peptidoglycan-binding domain
MGNGRGAWTAAGKDNLTRQYQYIAGKPLDGSSRVKSAAHYAVWLGVKAIQNELNTLPSTVGLLVEDGLFGQKTADAVRAAQSSMGLKIDGIAGSIFCSSLWRPLIIKSATEAGIVSRYLYGQMMHESTADPGACGYFHEPDRGLIQINTETHSDISIEQAHNPRFALPYSAARFRVAMNKYIGKGNDLQLRCAILSHNSPANADKLFATGRYPSIAAETYVVRVIEHSLRW